VKRLPDGTSRGFAFVKFYTKETVEKVVEARAKHMIDNKWVAVVARDSSEYGRHNETGANEPVGPSTGRSQREEKQEEEIPVPPEVRPDYEEKWSENYLQLAQQAAQTEQEAGGIQEEGNASGEATPQMMNMMMRMGMMPMGGNAMLGGEGTMPMEGECMMPNPQQQMMMMQQRMMELRQMRMMQMARVRQMHMQISQMEMSGRMGMMRLGPPIGSDESASGKPSPSAPESGGNSLGIQSAAESVRASPY